MIELQLECGDLAQAQQTLDYAAGLPRMGVPGEMYYDFDILASKIALDRGDVAGAEQQLPTVARRGREFRDEEIRCLADIQWAATRLGANDLEAAERFARDAVSRAQLLGCRRTRAAALCALGETLVRSDRVEQARDVLEEVLAMSRESENKYWECVALVLSAEGDVRLGNGDRSREHAGLALGIARQCGYRPLEQRALTVLDRDLDHE
jgi:hypothetical protein